MHYPRIPEFYSDADGRKLARVPLANRSEFATIDRDSWGELVERGISMSWCFNDNGTPTQRYVRCQGEDRRLTIVARLIVGAGPRTRIRYNDGDRLNLRRENLSLEEGGHAKHDCAPKDSLE